MADDGRAVWIEMVAAAKEYLKMEVAISKPAISKPAPAATSKPVPAMVTKPTSAAVTKPTSAAVTKPTPAAVTKPTPVAISKPTSAVVTKPTPTTTTALNKAEEKRIKLTPTPSVTKDDAVTTKPKPVLEKPPAFSASKLILATKLHPKFHSLYSQGLEHLQLVPSREEWEGDALHVLAMDCEMVQTTEDDMALARISVLELRRDWRNEPKMVLDELVMPCASVDYIVDARTTITGLTPSQLARNGLSLEQARKRFIALLEPHTILVGHALEHDLLAMGIQYGRVIDTALLFDVEGATTSTVAAAPGTNEVMDRRMHSLAFLYEGIVDEADKVHNANGRNSRGGTHDSVEDALMAFKICQTLLCNKQLYEQDFPIVLPGEEAKWKRKLATERGAKASLIYDRIVANQSRVQLRLDELKKG